MTIVCVCVWFMARLSVTQTRAPRELGQAEKSQFDNWIRKQAFRECVSWFSKQMITLNCDRIELAAQKKRQRMPDRRFNYRKKNTSAQM